ncbi:MAG: hypothetical protein ACREOO_28070 [bacterium]
MNNVIAYTVMLGIIVLAGLYMVWWIERQERKEKKLKDSKN